MPALHADKAYAAPQYLRAPAEAAGLLRRGNIGCEGWKNAEKSRGHGTSRGRRYVFIDPCTDKGAPLAFVRALPRKNSAEEPVIPSGSEESLEAKSARWPTSDMTTGIAGLDIISPWLGQNQRPGEMLRRSAPQHDTLYRAGRRLCLHDDSLAPRRSIGRGFRFSRRRRRAFGRRSWPSRPVRRIPADLRGRSSIAAQ